MKIQVQQHGVTSSVEDPDADDKHIFTAIEFFVSAMVGVSWSRNTVAVGMEAWLLEHGYLDD